MKAITIRGVPPHLARIIQRKAESDGASINKTVIGLLEEHLVGPRRRERSRLHHDLDFLFGAWTKREAAAFERSLAEQRRVDPDLWK